MLGYSEFKKEYTECLQRELEPDGITLSPTEMTKVNGIQEGLAIRYPESQVAPVIYLREQYQEYLNMDTPIGELAKEQADYIRHSKDHLPDVPELDFQNGKDRLYTCLINKDKNQELLKNIPHMDVADMAVIARYRVSEESSILVDYGMCGQLKMTSEEVMAVAKENTYNQGYKCASLGNIVGELMQDAGASEDYMLDTQADRPDKKIMVLTNPSMIEGAALGADQRVMKDMHELIGGDFYVLPSSRHELILVPEDMGFEKEDLAEMVRGANVTAVSERDFLSDNVYECRGPAMTLSVAGESIAADKEPALEKTVSHSH